jgi:ribonuclease J
MDEAGSELVFVALGGLGEIGMNVALYGVGPQRKRKWLMVDCGIAFSDQAGVEIILPDLTFVEKIKRDLLGLIITHAHEDHIGAVAELWPRFQCPVFATPFAAALLAARLEGIVDAPDITVSTVKQGGRVSLDPFDVELIPVAHSIPES